MQDNGEKPVCLALTVNLDLLDLPDHLDNRDLLDNVANQDRGETLGLLDQADLL